MKIFLLIRRTKKYYETGEIDLGHMVPDHPKVLAAIARWNFPVPYLSFRRRLRLIAQISWSFNDFDGIIPWSDQSAVKALPENSWLVPMDEDDWLAESFINDMRNLSLHDDCRQISWGVFRSSAKGVAVQNPFAESCGYALKTPCDWQQITNHMAIKPEQSHRFRKILAYRNETIASLGYLMYRNPTNLEEALRMSLKPLNPEVPSCFAEQYKAYQRLIKDCLPTLTATSGPVAED